jgi:hypothetical protein
VNRGNLWLICYRFHIGKYLPVYGGNLKEVCEHGCNFNGVHNGIMDYEGK